MSDLQSTIDRGRRLIESTFLDTCLIAHRTLTPDGTGGQVETWVPEASPRPCRFGTLIEPDPSILIDAIYGPPSAQVLLALGTPYGKGDHITNTASGLVWLVVGHKTADSNAAVAERILIREV
jgi:hypothetical protein